MSPSDETGLDIEQRAIDHKRKRYLDEFYIDFNQCNFERSVHPPDDSPIQRYYLSDIHLVYCDEVDRTLRSLFDKWDRILTLFPSYAALEQYDKRFDSRTKEGRMFYEKLSVFQAWFNLNSEINRLISVLGRIMACTQCQMWPEIPFPTLKHQENSINNTSRPPTPSSTSSSEQRDTFPSSPSNSSNYLLTQTPLKQQYSTVSNPSRLSTSSSLSVTSENIIKRQHTIASIPSMDNINQLLTSTSPLTEFYYK